MKKISTPYNINCRKCASRAVQLIPVMVLKGRKIKKLGIMRYICLVKRSSSLISDTKKLSEYNKQ